MRKCLPLVVLVGVIVGCSADAPKPSGFISNYQMMKPAGDNRMRYESPKARQYTRFIVDPVEVRFAKDKMDPEDAAKVARELHDSMVKVITDHGLAIVSEPGVGVARVRLALTDIKDAKWYMKIHPASRFTGAGQGGAAMEGEVVDSVTGEQLLAVMQSDLGSSLNPGSFGTVSDVENVFDKWRERASATVEQNHPKVNR